MKNILKRVTVFTALLLAGFAFFKTDVSAATNLNKNIAYGTTYTAYDVTGNGKKDTLKVVRIKNTEMSESWGQSIFKGVKIYINGKAYTVYGDDSRTPKTGIETRLLRLTNGKYYFSISSSGFNNGDDFFKGLYRYKDGTVKRVVNLASYPEKFGSHVKAKVESVSGNSINMNISFMSNAMGSVTATFKYTYDTSAKEMKRASSTGKITDAAYQYRYADGRDYKSAWSKLTVAKTLYSDSACTKSMKSLKAGTVAKATYIRITSTSVNIKIVTKDGTAGWVKGIKDQDMSRILFKDCYYAG